MKPDHSHITLIVDRSGSMSSVRSDAEGGVNEFVRQQSEVPGTASLLLVEFDAPLDDREGLPSWYHVVHDGPIGATPSYKLSPRGNTALLDAIGRGITETAEWLGGLPDDSQPEHIFFVVQTDGHENASRDFARDAVQAMIKQRTDEDHWEFVFLGMGPDTWGQGHDLGFAGVTRSAGTGESYMASYGHTHSVIGDVRTGMADHVHAANAEVDEAGNVVEDEPTP